MKINEQVRAFRSRFTFDPGKELWVGIEQEAFVAQDGRIVPIVPEIIRAGASTRHGCELSACQIESRTNPCPIEQLLGELAKNEQELRELEHRHNVTRVYAPVAPTPIPLDVSPDPTGRYQRLVEQLPHYILATACWVAGLHVHVGMPDPETGLFVLRDLLEVDRSGQSPFGRLLEEVSLLEGNQHRLLLYELMAGPGWQPQAHRYWCWESFYQDAVEHGYSEDPRKNWALVRLSVHGTIEFRLFPTSNDHALICSWARRCRDLCSWALMRRRYRPLSASW